MRCSPALLFLVACGPTEVVVGDTDPTFTEPTDPTGETGDTGETNSSIGQFDDGQVLVVPQATGLSLYASDGSVSGATWSTLVGSCAQCGGEGATADGDGLLVAFTTASDNRGDIARIDAAGLDFRVTGFDFPHDAVRDPADGTILVTESTANRIRWIAGDGSSPVAVRQLDSAHPEWPGLVPNGVDRFDHGGRSWLVSSHRGTGGGAPPVERAADGAITLWDITDPAAPTLAWTFPPEGALDIPHGCILREFEGRWWLLWAHTEGATDGGSVGLAVTDDPATLPQYVADLVPAERFDFLRGVELTPQGWLYLTDTGGAGSAGRIVKAPMPSGLVPTGATGAVDADQVLLDLDGATSFAEDIDRPFEGWLWTPAFSLSATARPGSGGARRSGRR